jgi:fucose permease
MPIPQKYTQTIGMAGAIFFWPSAKYQKYGGFVGCTFVIGAHSL